MHEDRSASPAGEGWTLSMGERALDALLEASHLAAPHELAALIVEHGTGFGAHDPVAYLADLQQMMLVPFVGSAGAAPGHQLEPLPIDSTLAGRAFQHVEVLTQTSVGEVSRTRVWLPLLNGTERLGVLEVGVSDPGALGRGGPLDLSLRRFAAVVAELFMTKALYGDAIVRARRRAAMGLAAEIQWSVLPPLTFACQQVVVAGVLEPAYEVAGDSVDYAVDAGRARFAVFDGMGHGLQSAQLALLSVAAYRNARRNDRSLAETASMIDSAVEGAFGGQAFTTAVLAELDTDTGVLSWLNAGHPEPLLLREGRLVKTLHAPPGLPFGVGVVLPRPVQYVIGSEHLQPGDRVLFYTDGVTEARAPNGDFFGVERLVDLMARNFAAALPPPETMRRVIRALMDHQQGQLSDDATMLLLEWASGTQRLLLP